LPSSRIIKTAIKTALDSKHEFTVGCVVYSGSTIIKTACNTSQYLGYRKNLFLYIPTRHAELNAIHGVEREVLKQASVLVVRVDRKGKLVSAQPCSACLKGLIKAQIRRVYYSNYQGEIVRLDLDNVDLKTYEKERRS